MNTKIESPKPVRNNKPFVIGGVVLIVAIWIGVFAALATLEPDLRTKALILAGGAGATELILYAGAAWFGVKLFQRFRPFTRSNRN